MFTSELAFKTGDAYVVSVKAMQVAVALSHNRSYFSLKLLSPECVNILKNGAPKKL